jgi:opacity protein-like surface antigen|tara:strand:+ start:964 stop:1626 length:663 start_codon:yes stop_codon:yes gene_type:complete
MSKLKTLFLALVISAVTMPVMAGSGDFAGPYIGVQSSAVGVELDGSTNDAQTNVTSSSAGKFAIIVGAELGYALPLGEDLLIDVGVMYTDGEAKISGTSDDGGTTNDVTIEFSELTEYYIAPTVALSDTSSVYFKYGQSEAKTKVTGDVTEPSDLSGTTYAIGSRTVLSSGIYLRTEAGYTEYDKISLKGKGTTGGISTTTDVSADPTIAFGRVSVGFKF